MIIDVLRLKGFSSFHGSVKKYFKNPKAQKLLEWVTVFLFPLCLLLFQFQTPQLLLLVFYSKDIPYDDKQKPQH